MSDSFADLWNTSAPTRSTPPPQKLGSATPAGNSLPRRPQQDIFSLLSSSSRPTSNPSSRSVTPSSVGGAGISQRTVRATKPSSNGGDAFSELLSGSLSSATNEGAIRTIAERVAEAEQQKLESFKGNQKATGSPMSNAWDGLDSLANPTISLIPRSTYTSTSIATSASIKPAVGEAEDDLLGDFTTQPAPKASSEAQKSFQQAEIDGEFGNKNLPPHLPPREHPDYTGDLDFGDREDTLLDDYSNDEDDILGVLSKPIDVVQKRKPQHVTNSERNRETPSRSVTPTNISRTGVSSSRPVSPHPHIVGQIVEMGFSPQQARVALASTDSGLDVQSALEILLSNGVKASQPSPQPSDHFAPLWGSAPLAPSERGHRHNTPSPAVGSQDKNIQEHADKLLAQASEIGLTMFNRASSFWKDGKERMQKAYVERSGATTSNMGSRPRWMFETPVPMPDSPKGNDQWLGEPSGFSDEVESTTQGSKDEPAGERQSGASKPKLTFPDLFSDDAQPAVYVSPFRWGKSSQPPSSSSTPPPPASISAPARRANLVSASPSAIALANKHKDAGTAKFKLGQYAEAESLYTTGIGALPSGHLLLVPLYNNRALARLKTGDHMGTIEDARMVVELIGVGYHPQREMKVEKAEEGAGVELGDALVKALKRRAEAWEGREKWEEAGKDWGMLAGLEWSGGLVRSEATRAAGRCRRMLQQSKDNSSGADEGDAKKPPPVAKSKSRAAASQSLRTAVSSQALENLRIASNAAEAEEQQKHELKDTVDAKLFAWKGGKESNIRALLGSLDTVLWPELGLQKVGMAELVTPSQVKIKYTRTIAKLHPDKLASSNTTVEQKMLANGVFGALNEAWNAFKQ